MSKPSQKKIARQKRRKLKKQTRALAHQKELASKQNAPTSGANRGPVISFTYPPFSLSSNAPVDVREAISNCWDQRLFDDIKDFEKKFEVSIPKEIAIGTVLQRRLMNVLTPRRWRQVDVAVMQSASPLGEISLHVRELKRIKPFVFASPREPTVEIDGRELRVAYDFQKDHFVERLEQRTVVDPDMYTCKGQLFDYMYSLRHFDIAKLNHGQHAVRLWDYCDWSIKPGNLWIELLGPNVEQVLYRDRIPRLMNKGRTAYYLVGYCPVHVRDDDGLAVLGTLLLPGMKNTPESRLIAQETKGDSMRYHEMQKLVGQLQMQNLAMGEGHELIRFFHSKIPQIRFFDLDIFDHATDDFGQNNERLISGEIAVTY